MRLCNAYVEMGHNTLPEMVVTNKNFKGWKVRYYRTANNEILKEYISHGESVDFDFFNKDDNYQLMMGMLQSDEWELCQN